MTTDQVRQLALSLPQATEEPHFEFASFRVRGKIFATLPPEGEYLHLFVADEQRDQALAEHPDFCEPLRWGSQVSGLRVLLPAAQSSIVSALLTQAWSRKAPKSLTTRSSEQPYQASLTAPAGTPPLAPAPS